MDLLLSATDASAIRDALTEHLGGVHLSPDPAAVLTTDAAHVLTLIESTHPDLPVGLDIVRWPGRRFDGPFEPWLLDLAAALSRRLACDVLCSPGPHAPPGGGPYWSVLWRSGQGFLVDDRESDAEPPGPPRIVRAL